MPPFEIIFWMVTATLILGILIIGFSWVLTQREVPWWEERVHRFKNWFPQRRSSAAALIHNILLLAAAWIIFALALTLLYALTQIWPGESALVAIDQAIYASVDQDPTGWLVTVFTIVTRLADVLTVSILSAIIAAVLLWRGHGWTTWALFMTVIGGMGMTWLMKMVTDRARPEGGLIGTSGQSFPSGHGTLSMLMYGFLIYLVWRFIRIRWVQIALTTALALLILTIGASRIILSVHWASDVIAGYILALTWMIYSLATARVLREASRVAVEN